MALKLYPLGIQTFERIRKENKLYIDKTEYVYRLTHTSGTYFFLGRPRRFGKSLFLTTLQSYFEGKKDLFNGLAIEKLEKEWTEYPVLHFDLSGGKHMNKEQLERYLAFILETEEKKWGITQPQIDANNRLTELINTAYEKSGKQVVVLIDEYDAPMLDVAHEQEQLDTLRNIMRNFFSPLKYSEAKLRFVFLTGITKFSQISIFSELNNISNISMKDDYAGICGITETELLDDMQDGIAGLAQANELTPQQVVAKLKENYDGYHFSAHSPGVFNPFSLLSSLANKDFDSYWFASGTPTYLVNMLQRFNVQPASLQRMCAKSSAFDSPTETMKTITPLLYQSGYITIKGYDKLQDGDKLKGDEQLEGLKVVNDHEFTVDLNRSDSVFAIKVGYNAFAPLPESFFKDPKAFGEKPVGNGPYKFQSWDHDNQIVLVKNPGSVAGFGEIVESVLSQRFDSENLLILHTRQARFIFDKPVSWTRDGEAGGEYQDITLKNYECPVQMIF